MHDTNAWAFFEKWATEQGISRTDWHNWRKRGVPYKHRLAIDASARARRFKLDPAAFAQKPAREGNSK